MILNEANPTVDVMKLAPGALNLRDNIILDRADVEERDSNAAPIWQRLTSSVSKSSSAGVGTGTSSSGEMEIPHHFFRPSDMASFVTFPNSPHSSSAIIRHLDAVDSKQMVEDALNLLRGANVDPATQLKMRAMAQRIAEATNDLSMTIVALLYEPLLRDEISVDAVASTFGREVAILAENCAELVTLHGDARDLLWAEKTVMRLNKEQSTDMQNMLITMAHDWRVVTLVLMHHVRRLDDLMGRTAADLTDRCLAREAYVLAREALDVYGPLAHRLGMKQVKDELEDLGFQHIFADEHAAISREIEERFSKHQEVLQNQLLLLKRALQEDTHFMNSIAHVSFEARSKQPYSIWRKMKKIATKEGGAMASMDQVLDHLALRVVFSVNSAGVDSLTEIDARKQRGKEMCYHVLDLVHQQWSHKDFKLKDYIRQPKANGYQSLHTTALERYHGKNWPFEVQIRTQEMHRVAEWGNAAHFAYVQDKWSYLAEERTEPPDESPLTVEDSATLSHYSSSTMFDLPSVMPERVQNSRDYAGWLHDELSTRRVYIFLDGVICSLERGMTVKEAVWRRKGISNVQEILKKISINGNEVDENYVLSNGDTVKIAAGYR